MGARQCTHLTANITFSEEEVGGKVCSSDGLVIEQRELADAGEDQVLA